MKSTLIKILFIVSMLLAAAAGGVDPVSAKTNPDEVLLLIGQGLDHIKKGQHDLAIADYTKLLEIHPQQAPSYHLMRGNVYSRKEQWDLAIADYNKALKGDPKITDVYYSRGVAYANKKQNDLAIADFNKYLEVNPKDAEAYVMRAYARASKGNPDRASCMLIIADLNKALEIRPTYAKAYWLRGQVYGLMGEKAKSQEDIDRAARLGFRK